jgi:predicted glycosyltransferase involved in capsule biosynthesis
LSPIGRDIDDEESGSTPVNNASSSIGESEERDVNQIIEELKNHVSEQINLLNVKNEQAEKTICTLSEKLNDYEMKMFDMQHLQSKQDKLID